MKKSAPRKQSAPRKKAVAPDAPEAPPAPKAPPAQEGDVEVARAVATPAPKHQSEADAKAELDAHPSRTSALSDKGLVVREP